MSDRNDPDPRQLTQKDFLTLPLEELAARTGLTPPSGASEEQVSAWREKAYEDYRLDLENRAEWGTAAQGTPLPTEDPEAYDEDPEA